MLSTSFTVPLRCLRFLLAWSIMGGSESLCEGVWINFWKHRAKQINVTTGMFLMFISGDGEVQDFIRLSWLG